MCIYNIGAPFIGAHIALHHIITNNEKMPKKLDSVRRSLFQEFDDDTDKLEKLGNASNQKTSRTSIKINSTAIAVVVILTVAIAAFSKFFSRAFFICLLNLQKYRTKKRHRK